MSTFNRGSFFKVVYNSIRFFAIGGNTTASLAENFATEFNSMDKFSNYTISASNNLDNVFGVDYETTYGADY